MASPEDIRQQQQRLQAHRQTLAHYLLQQAQHGSGHIPPAVSHGIREARQAIRQIKETLRLWDVSIEDHPDDEHPPLENQPISYQKILPKQAPQSVYKKKGQWLQFFIIIGGILAILIVIDIIFSRASVLKYLSNRIISHAGDVSVPSILPIQETQISSTKSETIGCMPTEAEAKANIPSNREIK